MLFEYLKGRFSRSTLIEVKLNCKNVLSKSFELIVEKVFKQLRIRVLRVRNIPSEFEPKKLYDMIKYCSSLRYVMIK